METDARDSGCGSASFPWERCRSVGLAEAGMERGEEVRTLLLSAGEDGGGMLSSEGESGSGRVSRGSGFPWMGLPDAESHLGMGRERL